MMSCVATVVPWLQLQRRPVDCAAIQPWRRASLEAPEREPGTLEGARKPKRRRLPNPAGWNLPFPDMNEPAQKCAGGQHNRGRGEFPPIDETHPGRAPLPQQIVHLALDDGQIGSLP
jgi:hypothetical protein